jgi:crotonobetainyl-CoA:carnitine CoA-transferase CaiB-like acyl-CoA transferase
MSSAHKIFQQWVLTFSTIETLDAQLDAAKLAFGIVNPIADFADSEWSKLWGAIMEVYDRNGGVVRVPGRPWRFSGGELRHPGRPAFRGEHNAEVLKELGIADSEIARLEQKGAIVSAIPTAAS